MFDLRMKKLFFDSPKVVRAMDRTTRKVLRRFGAFVRRTALGSIRKRKKTSKPGKLPSSHTGLLRNFIRFDYDSRQRSAVIGPIRLTKKGRGEAPRILEYGGSTVIKDKGKRKRVRIQPRPFMRPAFAKKLPELPAMWRDSVQ